MKRLTLLAIFIFISLIPTSLGLQNNLLISSSGRIAYPSMSEPRELGIFMAWTGMEIPDEATWVVAEVPSFQTSRADIKVILNWFILHIPWPYNPFETEEEIKEIEQSLMGVPAEEFWGITFINEEHYRKHCMFNDDVNTTWFGEELLGYPLYLQEAPGTTQDEWLDEMYLRMIRGFHQYFSGKGLEVGITMSGGTVVSGWRGNSKVAPDYNFGWPAFNFIKEYYDFIYAYSYSRNLQDFQWTNLFYDELEQHFPDKQIFWILTRYWDWSPWVNEWELEVIALEVKNAFDRNYIITSYANALPQNSWDLLITSTVLYNQSAPYFEVLTEGTNLLTDLSGTTYGWVEVS